MRQPGDWISVYDPDLGETLAEWCSRIDAEEKQVYDVEMHLPAAVVEYLEDLGSKLECDTETVIELLGCTSYDLDGHDGAGIEDVIGQMRSGCCDMETLTLKVKGIAWNRFLDIADKEGLPIDEVVACVANGDIETRPNRRYHVSVKS